MKRLALAAMAVTATAAGFWILLPAPAPTAADPARLALGQRVYAAECASCHGANLEGQANWREPGPDGRYPAPPH
ncbi:c-type cytochrome, partial [Rhodobacter sp. NSM]|uniref:c-type cytochrome n=1 Tax=Rhodobacter sp. NSM TaxID=3457501 RepID=UPI003FD09826